MKSHIIVTLSLIVNITSESGSASLFFLSFFSTYIHTSFLVSYLIYGLNVDILMFRTLLIINKSFAQQAIHPSVAEVLRTTNS